MAKVTLQKGLLWPVLLGIYIWNAFQQNATKPTLVCSLLVKNITCIKTNNFTIDIYKLNFLIINEIVSLMENINAVCCNASCLASI